MFNCKCTGWIIATVSARFVLAVEYHLCMLQCELSNDRFFGNRLPADALHRLLRSMIRPKVKIEARMALCGRQRTQQYTLWKVESVANKSVKFPKLAQLVVYVQ